MASLWVLTITAYSYYLLRCILTVYQVDETRCHRLAVGFWVGCGYDVVSTTATDNRAVTSLALATSNTLRSGGCNITISRDLDAPTRKAALTPAPVKAAAARAEEEAKKRRRRRRGEGGEARVAEAEAPKPGPREEDELGKRPRYSELTHIPTAAEEVKAAKKVAEEEAAEVAELVAELLAKLVAAEAKTKEAAPTPAEEVMEARKKEEAADVKNLAARAAPNLAAPYLEQLKNCLDHMDDSDSEFTRNPTWRRRVTPQRKRLWKIANRF